MVNFRLTIKIGEGTMITIKSKLAYRSIYIAISAIIIFSLLIFYLPLTAKAVNLSLNGVSSSTTKGSIEMWMAQFDFYPDTHPGIADTGGDYDFLPYWSEFRIIIYDSNGAQVAFARFNWDGRILSGSPHFLMASNEYDGHYYFLPNPAASTDVGYGYGYGGNFWSGVGYGYGFQPGDLDPPGYGVFDHTWGSGEYLDGEYWKGYGPMNQSGSDLLFEPPGPRYQINFNNTGLPLGDYTARLEVHAPDISDPYKHFLSDSYNFQIELPPAIHPVLPAGGPPPPGNVEDVVNSKGVFTDNASVRSLGIEINIPEGTEGLVDGEPITDVTIDPVSPPAPPEGSTFIGMDFDLGPSGAEWDPAIAITFSPDDIPPGATTVAYFDTDTGEWVELATEDIVFNPDGSITAYVTHFTYFSVLVRQNPASFSASGLSITPSEVDIAEPVTISAKVTNTGDLAGELDVILKINGVEVSYETVSLNSGSSQTLTFTTVQGKAGKYAVSLNGATGSFTVRPVSTEATIITAPPIPPLTVEYPSQPAPAPPTPTPTGALPPTGAVSWWVILVIAVASVVVVGGSLWLLVFRRGA